MLADRPIACPIPVGRARGGGAAALAGALVAGEAGIGKSRLAAAARAWAVELGFGALQGNCFEPDRVLPYAPVLDLLRAALFGFSSFWGGRRGGPHGLCGCSSPLANASENGCIRIFLPRRDAGRARPLLVPTPFCFGGLREAAAL